MLYKCGRAKSKLVYLNVFTETVTRRCSVKKFCKNYVQEQSTESTGKTGGTCFSICIIIQSQISYPQPTSQQLIQSDLESRFIVRSQLGTSIYTVDRQRRFNVYKTSMRRQRRRIDVLWALKQRRVSTGSSGSSPCVGLQSTYILKEF